MKLNCRAALIILGVAALYAIIARLFFAWGYVQEVYTIVSFTFIFLVPMSFGALVSGLGFYFAQPSTFWAYAAPAVGIMALLLLSVVFYLEAALCALVAIPIWVPMAMLGGGAMSWLFRRRDGGPLFMSVATLLPFALAPLEALWEEPHEQRRIENVVHVSASPSTVWRHIVSVSEIHPSELPDQWIYLLGFPKPRAAIIDREGVGGRRWATFERNVAFYETVTQWEREQMLSFTISADPEFIPHTAFDQHIIVGGRFYNVLNGTYRIVSQQDGTCDLHLWSEHRLSTRFNWYTGWWSEWVMHQIQGSILQVIQQRCQRRFGSPGGASSH